jgi:putative transposase
MSYSIDLRKRVLAYVLSGGSKTEAAALFGIRRNQIYVWLRRGDKVYSLLKPGPKRPRKVDLDSVKSAIDLRPDCQIKELSRQFGVQESSISRALKRLGMSRKKNAAL